MKSKTSFFNPGLFRNSLRRFWPMWALYAGAALLTLSNIIVNDYSPIPMRIIDMLREVNGEVSVLLTFAAAIIIAGAMFSFLYGTKTSGLISSIPVKRGSVFATVYLSGLIPFVAVNCFFGLILMLMSVGHGEQTAYAVKAVLIWLSVFTMEFVAFYGLAVFCATLTGNLVSMVVLYGILSVLSCGVELLIRGVGEMFVFGVSADLDVSSYLTSGLSPLICLLMNCSTGTVWNPAGKVSYLEFSGWEQLGIWCIIGIVLAYAALILYRRRRMENTFDVIAVPRFRGIFKYGVTVCFALVMGLFLWLLFDCDDRYYGIVSVFIFTPFMMVGAFVGYFGSEMLLNKSLHVFRNRWKGYIILSVLFFVCITCASLDVFKLGAYTPEADDIEYVHMNNIEYRDRQNITDIMEMQKLIFENRDELSDFTDDDYEYVTWVSIEYTLKNGRSVFRCYEVCYNESDPAMKLFADILNRDEAVRYRTFGNIQIMEGSFVEGSYEICDEQNVYNSYNLSSGECYELYTNGILKDLEAHNYGYVDPLTGDEFGSDFICFIHFTVRGNANTDYGKNVWFLDNDNGLAGLDIGLCLRMTNTLQWFKENKGVDFESSYRQQLGYIDYENVG